MSIHVQVTDHSYTGPAPKIVLEIDADGYVLEDGGNEDAIATLSLTREDEDGFAGRVAVFSHWDWAINDGSVLSHRVRHSVHSSTAHVDEQLASVRLPGKCADGPDCACAEGVRTRLDNKINVDVPWD